MPSDREQLKAEVRAQDLILGSRWADVSPQRIISQKDNPGEDVRTLALRALRKYISELTFYRRGPVGKPPEPFSFPEHDIHIGYPDNERDITLPCVVFEHGEETYDGFGLQPQVLEHTRDKFQPGTVLLHHYTQTEDFIIEVWTGKKPERRAIVAGLQTAFMVSDEYYGLRLRVPEYFNQPVMFTVMSTNRPDTDAIKGRRQAMMKVNYRVEVLQLIPYVPLEPIVSSTLLEANDPRGMTCEELQANGFTIGTPPQPNPPTDWRPVPMLPFNFSDWFKSNSLANMFPFKPVLDLFPKRFRNRR